MDQISRKTGNVAAFPLKLDLQLFADDGETIPDLESTPEYIEDSKEFTQYETKVAKATAELKAKETPVTVEKPVEKEPDKVEEAVKQEVATPEKPKQDKETNDAFQEQRKAREAAEAKASALEEKAKKADELISKQWGHLGVHTVEQYEQRLQQEQVEEDNERYTKAGLTPQEIEKLRKFDELAEATETITKVQQQEAYLSSWKQLYNSYPDIEASAQVFNEGKEPEWYNAEMKAEIAKGASPLAAYRNAHFETIIANATKGTKEAAKQEALNQLNSKDHIKANATIGGNVDHVEISAEQMMAYRKLTGQSDAEIRKFHKKQLAGG
jgi:hypothetical protein